MCLSLQDMDLIEVLWKQDVDLGFSLEVSQTKSEKPDPEGAAAGPTTSLGSDDNLEKLKALKAAEDDAIKVRARRDF